MFVVLFKMYLFIFIYRRDFILKAYSKGVGMGLWTMFVVLIYIYINIIKWNHFSLWFLAFV